MWRSNKAFLQFLIIIGVLLFSALAVNGMMAQGDDPVATPESTFTFTPTFTETPTPTETFTFTPLPTETPTDTPTATTIPTETPTQTPLPTDLPTQTVVPTQQVTSTPSAAATATVTATMIAPLVVTQAEPAQITTGRDNNISILGANFTESTTVRLVGYGFLSTKFINANALTATVPSTIPTGSYVIQVSDPVTGTALAPNALTVIPAPVTPTVTPVISATPKPTDIPGEPDLVIRSFSANPNLIQAGDSTRITFELVNMGNRTAEGVVVSLGDGNFSPADGQASVTVANLAPSASATVTLGVTAPTNATEGAASIPLVLSSRDFSGSTYRDDAVVSVNIGAKETLVSQVLMAGYAVTPTSAQAGEEVSVQAVITNTGNATATQILVQLDTANAVLIAGSQGSSFTVGDLAPNASQSVTMPLIVAENATEGIQAQNFTITYLQDGESKQASASISLQVNAKETLISQVLMNGYTVQPTAALPGETVTVQAVISNSGNEDATQVLVQLSDGNAVLIAGSQGNSFTVGDLAAGESKTVIMPLIVANGATAGVQAQNFTITYLQNGESKQATGSISLEVKPVIESAPVLLLQSYSTGSSDPEGALQPGQQFTYQMTIQNAGTQNVSSLLITFGTVKTDSSSGTGATGSDSSSSSTTSSTSFATIGSGDTLFVGDLVAGSATTISQQFIVNSDVASGIYNLPITLQYVSASGSSLQQSLNANLIVVVQPRLRVTQTATLPTSLTARESYTLTLQVANLGSTDAALSKMRVTGTNVQITEGAEIVLDPLSANDDTSKTVTILPQAAGDYSLTIEVDYIDALNRPQTYSTTLTGTVIAPAARATQTPSASTSTTTQNQSFLERLLMGFLGLGG